MFLLVERLRAFEEVSSVSFSSLSHPTRQAKHEVENNSLPAVSKTKIYYFLLHGLEMVIFGTLESINCEATSVECIFSCYFLNAVIAIVITLGLHDDSYFNTDSIHDREISSCDEGGIIPFTK